MESRQDWSGGVCGHCGSAEAGQAQPLLDVFLWCHMPEEPQEAWPLRVIEEQFGLRRDRDLCYTPEHGHKSALAPQDMPMLYGIWDCLLFLSGGEGFGLPAWEGMCSALPVIYTNYSSHAELLNRAKGGVPVGGILQPEEKTCIWRMVADIPQTIEAVRKLYFNREIGHELGQAGRRFVQGFSVEIQVEAWHQTFRKLAKNLH